MLGLYTTSPRLQLDNTTSSSVTRQSAAYRNKIAARYLTAQLTSTMTGLWSEAYRGKRRVLASLRSLVAST